MRTEFLCISVLKITVGPRVKLASCKCALNSTVVNFTDRSKAVVPVLVLLFFCFVVYSTRRFVLCLTLCYFVLVVFIPFSIAITSLGEKRAHLSAFFLRLLDLCLFSFVGFLTLGDWERLRFVIVALPGLLSYLFFYINLPTHKTILRGSTLRERICYQGKQICSF